LERLLARAGLVLVLVLSMAMVVQASDSSAGAATGTASCSSGSVSSTTSTFTATNSTGGNALVIVNGTSLQLTNIGFATSYSSGTGSPSQPVVTFSFTLSVPCGAPEVGQYKVPKEGLIPAGYGVAVYVDGSQITPQSFVQENNHYHVVFSVAQGVHQVSMVFSPAANGTSSTSETSSSTVPITTTTSTTISSPSSSSTSLTTSSVTASTTSVITTTGGQTSATVSASNSASSGPTTTSSVPATTTASVNTSTVGQIGGGTPLLLYGLVLGAFAALVLGALWYRRRPAH